MEDMPDLASEFEEKEDAYDEDDEFDKIEVQSLSLYLLALSLSLSLTLPPPSFSPGQGTFFFWPDVSHKDGP